MISITNLVKLFFILLGNLCEITFNENILKLNNFCKNTSCIPTNHWHRPQMRRLLMNQLVFGF